MSNCETRIYNVEEIRRERLETVASFGYFFRTQYLHVGDQTFFMGDRGCGGKMKDVVHLRLSRSYGNS